MTEPHFMKEIPWFGGKCVLACDGKCAKAWGINSRPRVEFDEDDLDDFAYYADDELGIAPEDPGTYEGSHGKPNMFLDDAEKMNKWCARECERSTIVEPGEEIRLSNFNERLYNMPRKHGVNQ